MVRIRTPHTSVSPCRNSRGLRLTLRNRVQLGGTRSRVVLAFGPARVLGTARIEACGDSGRKNCVSTDEKSDFLLNRSRGFATVNAHFSGHELAQSGRRIMLKRSVLISVAVVAMAGRQGSPGLQSQIAGRLQLYQAGRPYVERQAPKP